MSWINRVRNAPKQPGVEQITIPGERGDAVAAAVIASGSIPVESNLWNDLQKVAAEWKGN